MVCQLPKIVIRLSAALERTIHKRMRINESNHVAEEVWELPNEVQGTCHDSSVDLSTYLCELPKEVLGNSRTSPRNTGKFPPKFWKLYQSTGNFIKMFCELHKKVLEIWQKDLRSSQDSIRGSSGNRPSKFWKHANEVLGAFLETSGNFSRMFWKLASDVLRSSRKFFGNFPRMSWEHLEGVLRTSQGDS